jgi:hypothetical protein
VPGRKGAQVPTEQRYCKTCGEATEHRQYVRRNRVFWVDEDGERHYTGKVYVGRYFRCYPCLVRAQRRYQLSRGIDVGARSRERRDVEGDSSV